MAREGRDKPGSQLLSCSVRRFQLRGHSGKTRRPAVSYLANTWPCEPRMNGPIDAELLGRLLDEHGAALALYASQWTDAADDCVQEALVELARQPQVPEHVVAWLYRVVKNRALNAARGARRRRERESRAMAERFAVAQQSAAFDRGDSIAAIEALEQLETERPRTGRDANLGRIDIRRDRRRRWPFRLRALIGNTSGH